MIKPPINTSFLISSISLNVSPATNSAFDTLYALHCDFLNLQHSILKDSNIPALPNMIYCCCNANSSQLTLEPLPQSFASNPLRFH
ncbi:hypothetical protein LIER_01760 [Lithospermum erythrorhizon]|uniref:Uncharacterized protein n=1 Tax=Lithospermum erythrorhizon TaxID=34254 RepID=A0AAV3NMJ9_LITER